MTVLVKLLSKPGCCACEPAKFVLKRVKARINFEGKVVNILKHPEYMQYQNEIPVVLVNEEVICKSHIVESDIFNAVKKATES